MLIFLSFHSFFQVQWSAAEHFVDRCTLKGKSKEVKAASHPTCCLSLCLKSINPSRLPLPISSQTDCLNYIRVLQAVDAERLYVCGTHAFQPQCDYLVGQGPLPLQTAPSGSLQSFSVFTLSTPPCRTWQTSLWPVNPRTVGLSAPSTRRRASPPSWLVSGEQFPLVFRPQVYFPV